MLASSAARVRGCRIDGARCRSNSDASDATMPCSGHCTVPCGVPDEEEDADAQPVPSAPTPPPIASPVRVSSACGFNGAGPDLRPQMNACAMQRNALAQYASRVGKCVYCALCVRSCLQARCPGTRRACCHHERTHAPACASGCVDRAAEPLRSRIRLSVPPIATGRLRNEA
jgi:hypothetical protein